MTGEGSCLHQDITPTPCMHLLIQHGQWHQAYHMQQDCLSSCVLACTWNVARAGDAGAELCDAGAARFDHRIERTLRQRRRDGRHMPHMVVIPPGLDFTNLKVDLPRDPALDEMRTAKPAFGASPVSSDAGSPRPPVRGGSMANLRTPEEGLPPGRTSSGLPRPVSMASLRQLDGAPLPPWASIHPGSRCHASCWTSHPPFSKLAQSALVGSGFVELTGILEPCLLSVTNVRRLDTMLHGRM